MVQLKGCFNGVWICGKLSFNSKMVQLKEWEKKSGARNEASFNSKMVQLKAGAALARVQARFARFNSKMVQLKDAAGVLHEYRGHCFNSKMVQLKARRCILEILPRRVSIPKWYN